MFSGSGLCRLAEPEELATLCPAVAVGRSVGSATGEIAQRFGVFWPHRRARRASTPGTASKLQVEQRPAPRYPVK